MGIIQAHQNMIFQKANTNVLWVVASHIRLVISGTESKETSFEENRCELRKGTVPATPRTAFCVFKATLLHVTGVFRVPANGPLEFL